MAQSDTTTGPADMFGAAAHERPVPRISIAAFCEFPDTGAVMQRAAADRRLSKAQTTVHLGGISGAAAYFTENPTPNLLVVETKSQGAEVLSELDALANVCDESTKVIVIGRANDVQLYRELVRRGVSEYMVAPLNPLQLIETIAGLYAGPEAKPIGRVIGICSTRGGAGSSTIAHNVAWHIAERMAIETAIVDFDLAFGTAGLNFNQDPGQGVADALAQPERLDDVLLDRLLAKCGDRLSLFAAPALLDKDYDAFAPAYEMVIDQVRAVVPCVVLDLPHVWTAWSRQALLACDDIVMVATPDLASLRNGKNMIDVLRHGRANDKPPRLVLNQTAIPKRAEIPTKEFATALGVEPSIVIPFEPQIFAVAANSGQMLAQVQPNSRIAGLIQQMAEILTGRVAAPVKKPVKSFLPFRKAS